MSPAAGRKLRLEDLRVESFVTSDQAHDAHAVQGAATCEDATITVGSYCTCTTCDVSASGSHNPCGSGCGYTNCCQSPTCFPTG